MLFASTVREELAYGPENLKFSKEEVEANVDWAIETVHLEAELSTPPPLALSFGQQNAFRSPRCSPCVRAFL